MGSNVVNEGTSLGNVETPEDFSGIDHLLTDEQLAELLAKGYVRVGGLLQKGGVSGDVVRVGEHKYAVVADIVTYDNKYGCPAHDMIFKQYQWQGRRL